MVNNGNSVFKFCTFSFLVLEIFFFNDNISKIVVFLRKLAFYCTSAQAL